MLEMGFKGLERLIHRDRGVYLSSALLGSWEGLGSQALSLGFISQTEVVCAHESSKSLVENRVHEEDILLPDPSLWTPSSHSAALPLTVQILCCDVMLGSMYAFHSHQVRVRGRFITSNLYHFFSERLSRSSLPATLHHTINYCLSSSFPAHSCLWCCLHMQSSFEFPHWFLRVPTCFIALLGWLRDGRQRAQNLASTSVIFFILTALVLISRERFLFAEPGSHDHPFTLVR